MRLPLLALSATLMTICSTAVPAPAAAQTALDQFEVSFQARETKRRAAIASTMRFNEEEATAFWPIYDQYRLTAKSHQLRRMRMVSQLSKNGVGMDAKTASSIMSSALALEAEQQSAKQKYMVDLKTHFSGARYFRLYQLETKLDALFRYGWTRQIPLAVTEKERELLEQAFDAKQAAEAAAELPTT